MNTTPKAPQSLLLLSAASGGLALFAVMAGLATTGEPLAFDRDILLALRSPENPAVPIGPEWLTRAAREVTALAGTPLLTLFTLIVGGYFAAKRHYRTMALLLIAVIGETLLSGALKDLFDRSRPDFVEHLVHASGNSFPSGHSTSAAAIYLTIAALIARETKERVVRNYVFFAAVLLAILVGASRVYLGVHYPTDVVGGLSFGAAWAAIVLIAAHRLNLKN
jgi:undecaprenyl-diphosphatase